VVDKLVDKTASAMWLLRKHHAGDAGYEIIFTVNRAYWSQILALMPEGQEVGFSRLFLILLPGWDENP
jgi:hypothetical protein